MRIWIVLVAVLMVVIGIASMGYVVSKCGAKGLLFGDNAVAIAAMGYCDE